MGYLLRNLVAIDQLGNTLTGGHEDVTISARTGYFANIADTPYRPWWRCMEAVIDFAFYPVDGPRHCYQAYLADVKDKSREGSDLARAALGILIVFACIPISIVTHIVAALEPDR